MEGKDRNERNGEGEARRAAAVGHQSVKRPPLERMDRILEWLQNAEYPNCSRMMQEFGVDGKRLPID